MSMTPLPPAPSSTDPANFDDRADELLAVALPLFVVEANELAADVSTKQETAVASAAAATEQAVIATTKAGQAGGYASAADSSRAAAVTSANSASTYMGFAEQAAIAANASKLEAALSAATIDPQSLSSDYAGEEEPPVIWALMTWADTGNMLLKRRNAANSDWVVEATLLKASLPQYAEADIPTTNRGDIHVIGKGVYSWAGAAYAPLAGSADITEYDNTVSGLDATNVQAAIDEVAESHNELDDAIDFAIIYLGGTPSAPANAVTNSRYVIANPFQGHHVICIAEVYYASQWGVAGWYFNGDAQSAGVVAHQHGGFDIVVQTAISYLLNNSAATGGTFGATGGVSVPLPCRIKVWKAKGAI